MIAIEPERAAKHLLRRLEAAAAATREMCDGGDLAAAYQNLERVERFAKEGRDAVAQAMRERRWNHGAQS